ncbi:Trifunctional NAD biosynthesis/regulator protein NadR [Anaerolineales bacterium]|nr:Trifunctional NAD biosynthesis/regulator protein NadR [Anaerolineales bacterium]
MGTTHGLTLGKFAPLHKGHQLVIETALAEMDEMSVIVYDAPETTPVPLNVRSDWIRELYPTVKVIEAWDGPTEVGSTPEIKQRHEKYVIEHLKVSGITHFYSSEFYGEHMSAALGATNRLVNPSRNTVAVSGTKIRENPFLYREYIPPVVYRDLITNVVFLGAPSTGKTTITRELADEYGTVWMPEYGREYWENNQVNRRLSLGQLVEIAEGHLERENELLYQANQYLFTDTNAITTFMFSRYYHQAARNRLVKLANMAQSRYDLVFLCDVDIPYDDTWDRSGDVNRIVFQKQIIGDLLTRKIPFITLRGNLKTRITKVKKTLSEFQKYKSLADIFMKKERKRW